MPKVSIPEGFRRWINANGSLGGLVACDASICGTTTIEPGAIVGSKSTVDAYANTRICKGAKIGSGCSIGAQVHIGPRTQIGDDTRIGNATKIGTGSKIGFSCVVGDCTCIGDKTRIEQGVIIRDWARVSDNVTIGASSIIDFQAYIKEHTKLSDSVFIGRNCVIGTYCVIKAFAHIAQELDVSDKVFVGPHQVVLSDLIAGLNPEAYLSIPAPCSTIRLAPGGQVSSGCQRFRLKALTEDIVRDACEIAGYSPQNIEKYVSVYKWLKEGLKLGVLDSFYPRRKKKTTKKRAR